MSQDEQTKYIPSAVNISDTFMSVFAEDSKNTAQYKMKNSNITLPMEGKTHWLRSRRPGHGPPPWTLAADGQIENQWTHSIG